MTVATHGVSASTPGRILLDAGVVYIGYTSLDSPGTLLGATKDGSVFEVNRTLRDLRPDGAKGPVKGFRRLEECVATLTVNLLEITETNLLLALAGSSASSHTITGGEVADADFISKVALLVRVSGFNETTAPIELVLSNVLVEGPLTIDAKPNDEHPIKLVFKAHYTAADLTTEPWSITYPAS